MERLKIDELIAERTERGKITDWPKLLDEVFADDIGKGRNGGSELSADRRRQLINAWNRGQMLTRLLPRHVIRIAEHFGKTRILDVMQERRPGCDEHPEGLTSAKSNHASTHAFADTKASPVNPEEGD
jgi:hypothetical protein